MDQSDIELAISQLAQGGVDEVLARCRNSGEDPIPLLENMILTGREIIHWANEAIAQIKKAQKE